ncbi:base plate protein, bacteriophage T4 [Desulfococcus multivorans]|uniref:Base plate protein, bacteriophage T4 n=1 Tax=Desulfococcus multivorans DSM 2059 TaxID=1121405 RepID=S7VEY6_DESML|nr:base plate protein, bacteriophage T4 [Desulfococcus multivorans]AOY59413.1 conserved uncharacterized protein [Desulfococcus multivorans]AQV01621.1 hypothetical protein B2D07_13200 [Desulfococcus multivorans]EPR43038.1 Base plate protein, bacteriophage T4 [Desulfococcus multivorans DSM 2059]SKA00255.1 T4 bacteriophage base plate protein [Desulfococcus multivorans DSM 2059]
MRGYPDIAALDVRLPNGLWLDEQCLQTAGLRPPTGYDEAHLLALKGCVSPARWTSEVLARCVTHIGTLHPVSLEDVQSLTVGDREALLLHLRRLSFGETLSCMSDCSACGEKLSIDLQISQLLLPQTKNPAYWYRAGLPGSKVQATFRLPTGADQEAIAELAAQDPSAAAGMLMKACLHSLTDGDVQLEILPEDAVGDLAKLIAERDPQAELILNSACPECGHQFDVLLDVGTFFAEEINHRLPYLYREVHLMAWHYHWSESEILSMTRSHRRIYLDLLDETLREATP